MMPIDFRCPCGKKLRAKDGSAGRVFDCPICGLSLEVPIPDAVDLGIATGNGDSGRSDDYQVQMPPGSTSSVATSPWDAPSNDKIPDKNPDGLPDDTDFSVRLARRPWTVRQVSASTPRVVIEDIEVPFVSMVVLILKFWAASFVATLLVIAMPVIILMIIGMISLLLNRR